MLSNLWHCIDVRLCPGAALWQRWFPYLTWTYSPVSSPPNLAWAHVQSYVSFCFFCRLQSGNSITNMSRLVSVNRSYIRTHRKFHMVAYTLYCTFLWINFKKSSFFFTCIQNSHDLLATFFAVFESNESILLCTFQI